jgi:hypothetical protein
MTALRKSKHVGFIPLHTKSRAEKKKKTTKKKGEEERDKNHPLFLHLPFVLQLLPSIST